MKEQNTTNSLSTGITSDFNHTSEFSCQFAGNTKGLAELHHDHTAENLRLKTLASQT